MQMEMSTCQTRNRSPQFSSVAAVHRLAEPDHHRLHVFGGSPVLHKEVNHALRFNHKVAPEEENTKNYGERQHAEHRDLHHTHDEEFALVLQQHQRSSAVAGNHVVGAIPGVRRQSPCKGLTSVKQCALSHVEQRDVHVSLRVLSEKTLGSS